MLRRTTRTPPLLLSSLLVPLALAAACSGTREAPGPRSPAAASPPAPLSACARVTPGAGAAPLAPMRTGAAVALARAGERTLAYVADEDARAVHAIELPAPGSGHQGRLLASTSLEGAPSQLLLADDGRLLVALRDRNAVQVLEPAADPAAPLASRCLAPTPAEPVGLALTPDAATLLVTAGWGASLTAYHASSLDRAWELPLAREPRAVVASDDGRRAFVSHVVGGLVSVIDLHARAARTLRVDGQELKGFEGDASDESPRRACQGFALAKSTQPSGRIFLPQVLVDPGDTEQPSGGYGDEGLVPAEAGVVAVLDEDAATPLASSLAVGPALETFMPRHSPSGAACLLPRAAAVDPERGELLVACMGIDALVAYDARAAAPHAAELRRVPLPAGPTGVALDLAARRAAVWSQFDRTLTVVPLGDPPVAQPGAAPPVEHIALGAAPLDAELALGRRLFHAADPRISRDGRACASCHPGGREDALTWATPDGPRQTPMLAGRLDDATAPFGWDGDGATLHDHLAQTMQRLGGAGLEPRELDALIAYARALPAPARPAAEGALVRRGAELFRSAETACASCHVDGLTDGARHDVGSRARADRAPELDTPSLRFIGGTAPYFHDGRYGTLREVLRHADGKMGSTKHLAPADLDALEAYLRTL